MKRVVNHHLFYPIILLTICLVICFLNYTPNTFLTGWDTLHPEFNFSTNFSRLISGVWRSDQGLGAVAAHSHMADLPRILILYLFHFVLPINFLRYFYIFLCLIVGILGSYYLIEHLFKKREFAFIGGLFYLFNLSTLQQFIVPFEMFCTQFAYLPIVLLFTLKYLNQKSKKDLLFLSTFTLLATPQAYAAHLWYAFFLIYFSFLVFYLVLNRNFDTLKKTTIILIITLVINSFWLLPNLYYIKTSSSIAKEYKYNRFNSQSFLLKNRETGNLIDSSIQKGFYFSWEIFNISTKKNEFLLTNWNNFTSTFEYKLIAYTIFLSSLIGLIICFIKRDKVFIPFSVFFLIPFIFLNNSTPPFSYLFDFLIKNSTIEEAFRFIFNKITTLYQIGILIYFIYFLKYIFNHPFVFSRKIFLIFSVAIIFTGIPYFQGQLIHPYLRKNIPQKYFDLYKFLNQQPAGRTVTLPLHQPTGWQYYNWGYQGSGFIWFGSQNSFLDRDSDRWSVYNDNSYQELYNAIYSKNYQDFVNVCQKYQIKYILWDQDNISTSSKNEDQITFKNEINELVVNLSNSNFIKQIYNQENLNIYEININSPIYTQNINTNITPISNSQSIDFAYQKFSDYFSNPNQNSYFFPFKNIVNHSNNQINSDNLSINFIDNLWHLNFSSPKNNQQVYLPNFQLTESTLVANLSITPGEKEISLLFDLPLPTEIKNQLKLNFTIPKNKNNNEIYFNNYQLIFDSNSNQTQNLGPFNLFTQEINTINNQSIKFGFDQINNPLKISDITFTGFNFDSSDIIKGNHSNGVTETNNKILLSSQNDTSGFDFSLNNLPHSLGYILAIKSQYLKGIPARICFKNHYTNQCSFEEIISRENQEKWNYFLIPSLDSDVDYNLEINSFSQGKFPSQSLISQVSLIPIPYQYLSQIYYYDPGLQFSGNSPKSNLSFKQNGTYFYKINSTQSLKKQIILSQAYNSSWVAFYFNGIKPVFLKNHVLVNNWANGWQLPPELTSDGLKPEIYIVFWPQIFEFLGFTLLIPTFIWIIKKAKKQLD